MCLHNGISRRTAALLIAAIQFIHGFSTFISAGFTMKNTHGVAFLVVVIFSAMNMWLALVLCVAIKLTRPSLLFLWLGWAVVILINFVICVPILALYSYIITEQFKGGSFATTYIMFTMSFFLHCFFVHVVYGYYEELVIGARLDSEIREEFEEQEDYMGPVTISGRVVSSKNEPI